MIFAEVQTFLELGGTIDIEAIAVPIAVNSKISDHNYRLAKEHKTVTIKKYIHNHGSGHHINVYLELADSDNNGWIWSYEDLEQRWDIISKYIID